MHVCAHVHAHEYAYACQSTGVKVRGLRSGVIYLLPLWVLSTELKLLDLCGKHLVFKFKKETSKSFLSILHQDLSLFSPTQPQE